MARKSNFRESLAHKRREMHDLANFIGTRAGNTPNYSLLLGAGCSITSGVRSAGELVEEWRRDLYQKIAPSGAPPYSREEAAEYFSRECSQWYNLSREYSSLFEKKFDLPRQRRMFVESEVGGKLPSIGYAYLMHLVKMGYFNTIFTTNFDDLLNEAFHYFSDQRPILCAHDSSIGSITVTSSRPKIIKLHGDYLFDDIKSTQRETESLEQNSKKKFAEFCKDFGLVVAGYSGSDRSIMDVLNGLLRNEEYLKNGVYWCIRSNESEIGEELERFLWRDRVYWVEVDGGFDELMAELYSRFVGTSLPVDTIMVSEKPRRIIERFCNSTLLSGSPSAIVQGHLAKFRRELQKEQVVDAFRGLRSADDDREPPEDALRDDQTAKILRINRLMSLREFRQAQQILAQELATTERDAYFVELARIKVEVDLELGETAAAKGVIQKLKDYDPNNAAYLNIESRVERKFDAKCRVLRASLKLEPYNTYALNRLGETLLDQADDVDGVKQVELVTEGLELYRKSIVLDGSMRNPAWVRLIRYLLTSSVGVEGGSEKEIESLLKKYEEMNRRDRDLLRLKIERLSSSKSKRESAKAQDLVDEIVQYRETVPRQVARRYDLLHLRALGAFCRRKDFENLVTQFELDQKFVRDPDFNEQSARGFAAFGEYDAALQYALKAFDSAPSGELALLVATTAEALKKADVFDSYGERMIPHLSAEELHSYQVHECRTRGDHAKAVKLIRARALDSEENSLLVEETHELLWAGQPVEAERIARVALEASSFSKSMGALIINYELARKAGGANPNKGRLRDLALATPEAEVRAAAYYLMGDLTKAAVEFGKIFEDRPGRVVPIRHWYLFHDDAGAAFLDGAAKGRAAA